MVEKKKRLSQGFWEKVYKVSILDVVSLRACSGPQQARCFAQIIALAEIISGRPRAGEEGRKRGMPVGRGRQIPGRRLLLLLRAWIRWCLPPILDAPSAADAAIPISLVGTLLYELLECIIDPFAFRTMPRVSFRRSERYLNA